MSRDLTLHRRVDRPQVAEPALFLVRRSSQNPRRPRRFTEKDLFLLLRQAILGLGAATTPRGWWPTLCRATSQRRRISRSRKELPQFTEKVNDVLGPLSDVEIAGLFAAIQRRLHERQMTYLRERFSRQPMTAGVAGLEHLEASLARGSGAILWNTPALGDTIVTKRALADAGHPGYQLSVHEHGFSQSPFAVRHVNPGQIAVEDRYLAGRIWFEGDDTVRATRDVLRRLKRNAPVIFTNSLHAGRSFVAVPVGSRFFLPLATTPLSIAARMAVPLHVVTTIEVEPFAHYVTHVSEDLAPGGDIPAPPDSDVRIADMALRARDAILGFARTHPDQIRIWDSLLDPADCSSDDLPDAQQEPRRR